MLNKAVFAAVAVAAGMSLAAVAASEDQKWCPLCSMDLKMFWKTHHRLTFVNGEKQGYCSIHCASIVYQDKATEIDLWECVDYDTRELINARTAHFLIGSDLPGTMTAVSKHAFRSLETAKRYEKDHGGKIGTFDDALRRSLADMGSDQAMIMKKVAEVSKTGRNLAQEHGCFACHGADGAGGKGPAWNSGEAAKRLPSRIKIKEKILAGGHQMEGYRAKLSEKDLHAITLYVWGQRPK